MVFTVVWPGFMDINEYKWSLLPWLASVVLQNKCREERRSFVILIDFMAELGSARADTKDCHIR